MTADNAISPLTASARTGILAYLGISAVVCVLMMLFGLLMRLVQAQWLDLPPDLFYQLMTAHGAGMVGISGLASSAVMWYFLRRHVNLTSGILWTNLVFFLLGVILILSGIFLGGYAGAWTFLYPLPSHSLGVWGIPGAAAFLIGLLLIGFGFLLLYIDFARAIVAKYGGLARGLGWPQLFGNSTNFPPAPVVAASMVSIVNIVGIVSAAIVLVLMLINLFVSEFALDPLLAKNLIYLFGHIFINATIYQAVVAVYEILPEYTKRPWKVDKVFLAAWTASTILVLIVYPHHLLMDFVMPPWLLVTAQITSYMNGFPILVVTAYGALTIVHRSNLRWDMASGLLFVAMFGWAAGVIPAIVDATISVNNVMHNTLWVPGHFHFYLIVGLVAMLFGFMYYLTNKDGPPSLIDKVAFWLYLGAGTGFAFNLLASGRASIPRRWAQHLPEWVGYSQVSSALAAVVAVAALIFALRFLVNLRGAKMV